MCQLLGRWVWRFGQCVLWKPAQAVPPCLAGANSAPVHPAQAGGGVRPGDQLRQQNQGANMPGRARPYQTLVTHWRCARPRAGLGLCPAGGGCRGDICRHSRLPARLPRAAADSAGVRGPDPLCDGRARVQGLPGDPEHVPQGPEDHQQRLRRGPPSPLAGCAALRALFFRVQNSVCMLLVILYTSTCAAAPTMQRQPCCMRRRLRCCSGRTGTCWKSSRTSCPTRRRRSSRSRSVPSPTLVGPLLGGCAPAGRLFCLVCATPRSAH